MTEIDEGSGSKESDMSSKGKQKDRVVIKLESGDEREDQSNLALCLVGKVWTVRKFNAQALMTTMEKMWNPNHGVEVKEIRTNLFLFQFFHWKDMKQVLDG